MRVRTLSHRKVQVFTDITVLIDGTPLDTFSSKQVLQQASSQDYVAYQSIPYDVVRSKTDLFIVTPKTKNYIRRLVSRKYGLRMKYISFSLSTVSVKGVWYNKVEGANVKMPLHIKREWRLRQILK